MSIPTRPHRTGSPVADPPGTTPWRVVCPDCGLPADVLDEFSLDSTSGPVPHLRTACPAGHRFTLPDDHPRLRPWLVDATPGEPT